MKKNLADNSNFGCDWLLAGSMTMPGEKRDDIAEVVRRSLEASGYSVKHIPFPQNTHRDEPGYLRELTKAVRMFRPMAIMPVGDMLCAARFKENILDKCREELGLNITMAVDSSEKISLLSSKVQCSNLVSSLAIPQPKLFSSPEQVESYPAVHKRDISVGGSGVHFPGNREALEHIIAHQPKGEGYLIEEFVEGECYSIDVLRFNNDFRYRCYKSVTRICASGPATERQTVLCPSLAEYAEKILSYIEYEGICGMDFIIDASGQAFFLECNPRFTGGLATQIESGFDIPNILAEHFLHRGASDNGL